MPKILEEDRLSEASFGSVISLRSVGSDDGFAPRPPLGAKKSKPGSKRASKVKIQDSPYIGKNAVPKKTGRELWVASIRQGTGMSAESSGMSTMNGMKLPHTGQSKAKASTSAYLLDQLLMATGRSPKNHARALSYTNVRVGGNGPAYKTAEEYYDEVLDLKKRINQLMRENEMIKSKMHKVEEDNFAKSRQIDELINPNMQSNEIRRTLTNKKPDANAVVTSLKHKLHSMERVVKSKDNELSKLKNDMKYTDLAELQIQNEVCHQEIHRLTMMLTEPRSSDTLQITSEIRNEKTTEGKLKKYGEAVESLSDDNNRLLMENKCLKQDLKKAMDLNSQTLNLSKDVEDMNRIELLGKISQLEQQLREDDGNVKEAEVSRSKRSPAQSRKFPGKPGEEIKRLEERESELLEEIEKLKSTISKLKEDRTHYRKLADEYRLQLEKIKSGGATDAVKAIKEEPEKLRSESVLSTSSSKKSAKKKSIKSTTGKGIEKKKENEAARTIQRNWRKHRDEKIKMENDHFNESVSTIQAAFRGHAARERLLRTRRVATLSDDDVDNMSETSSLYEEDVTLMQAAFRGHLSRRNLLDRKNRFEDYDSDYDDTNQPLRPRRSFDTGELMEPLQSRSSSTFSNSKRRNIFKTEDYTTRSSIERQSLHRSRKEESRDSQNYHRNSIDRNDDGDDDDDDDDVVIGSTSSLNSDSKFEQAYFSKYKSSSSQYSGRQQMSRIEEEQRSRGNNSQLF